MSAAVVVGTSSWADPGFVEDWYPQGLAARDRLPYYAERFDAVEVNSTFYGVPARSTVARWDEATPPGFTFDVKAHRLLSRHAAGLDSLPPDLRERAGTTGRGRVRLDAALEAALAERLLEATEPLATAGKLSTFLVQLSPAFAPGEHRLDELDALLGHISPHPVAIELRHRAWVSPKRIADTLAWYEDRGAVWVGVDAPPGDQVTIMPPVDAVTRDGLAYLRAHGRNTEGYVRGRSVAERFDWRYSDDELREIAVRAHALADQAGDDGAVRVMFNNNSRDHAPKAAQRARELLEGANPLLGA
jgi:uncharacterized protein YecE (DUF72 family)